MGRTECPDLNGLRASLRLEKATPSKRAKWRSSLSAYSSALKKFLTRADIVRDAIYRQLTGLVAYAGRLGRAVFDPPGRFPFHQVGHPRLPRYLWPLEQVFQPPRFAFGFASLGLDNNCFTNFAL